MGDIEHERDVPSMVTRDRYLQAVTDLDRVRRERDALIERVGVVERQHAGTVGVLRDALEMAEEPGLSDAERLSAVRALVGRTLDRLGGRYNQAASPRKEQS